MGQVALENVFGKAAGGGVGLGGRGEEVFEGYVSMDSSETSPERIRGSVRASTQGTPTPQNPHPTT